MTQRLRRALTITVAGLVALAAGPAQGSVAGAGDDVRTAGSISTFDRPGDAVNVGSPGSPSFACEGDLIGIGATATTSQLVFWSDSYCSFEEFMDVVWVGPTEMRWSIETTGDAMADYHLTVRNSLFSASLSGADGATLCSGQVTVDRVAGTIFVALPPTCLGAATHFRMHGRLYWQESFPGVSPCLCQVDEAPDAGYTAWVERPVVTFPVGDGPGAASAAPGQMDVFVRGHNDRLYTQHYNGATWGGYLDLGGIVTTTPAAASRNAGQLDVFVRGQDNALYTQHFNGTTWSGWTGLGGILTTAPAVVSRSPGTLDIFVAGFDRALYTMHYNGSSWSGWQNLGGIITATPAAASANPGTMAVFVRGQDNAAWHRTFDGATWGAWFSLGGHLTSAPAASSPAPGTYDVFGRFPDNALSTNRFNSAVWLGWRSLGGVIASPPAAVAGGDGSNNVFVRGQNARLYWNRADTYGDNWGAPWNGWVDLGGVIK